LGSSEDMTFTDARRMGEKVEMGR